MIWINFSFLEFSTSNSKYYSHRYWLQCVQIRIWSQMARLFWYVWAYLVKSRKKTLQKCFFYSTNCLIINVFWFMFPEILTENSLYLHKNKGMKTAQILKIQIHTIIGVVFPRSLKLKNCYLIILINFSKMLCNN